MNQNNDMRSSKFITQVSLSSMFRREVLGANSMRSWASNRKVYCTMGPVLQQSDHRTVP